MDNPSSESGALDTNQAAEAFANLLGGEEPEKKQEAQASDDPEARAIELAAAEEGAPDGEPSEEEKRYTVKIDGKEVEVPLSELVNGYQRQQDYTQKTMAAAEARKTAEAEADKTRGERQQYANQLQAIAQQLQGALQTQPDESLIESDPIEYMRQRHQYESWQARLAQVQTEQQKVGEVQKAEDDKFRSEYMRQQHQALLDKLPEWKDPKKATAESDALKKNLEERGFTQAEISQLSDHRIVIELREAMLYRQLMAKAREATKRVTPLPAKVERPGNADTSKPDGRTAAMQRLGKTGRVEDAATVFASFL